MEDMPPIPHARDPDEPEKARAWGSWVRTRRKALGLTQAQLGDLLGLYASYISRFENGRAYPNLHDELGVAAADRIRNLLQEQGEEENAEDHGRNDPSTAL